MYNYSKLRGRITELFGTQKVFATAVGFTSTRVSLILNGRAFLDQKSIEKWVEALKIEPEEIGAYFFAR